VKVSAEMHAMMTWGEYESLPKRTDLQHSRRGHKHAGTVSSGMVRAVFESHRVGAHN
jgi:hypothetical protein